MLSPQHNGAARGVQGGKISTHGELKVHWRGIIYFYGQLSCRSYAKINKSLISLQVN